MLAAGLKDHRRRHRVGQAPPAAHRPPRAPPAPRSEPANANAPAGVSTTSVVSLPRGEHAVASLGLEHVERWGPAAGLSSARRRWQARQPAGELLAQLHRGVGSRAGRGTERPYSEMTWPAGVAGHGFAQLRAGFHSSTARVTSQGSLSEGCEVRARRRDVRRCYLRSLGDASTCRVVYCRAVVARGLLDTEAA